MKKITVAIDTEYIPASALLKLAGVVKTADRPLMKLSRDM